MKSETNGHGADQVFERQLAARLAEHFQTWSGTGPFCTNGVGTMLDIAEEDVEILCVVGLLKGAKKTYPRNDRRIEAADLLAFLKAYGDVWFRVRLAKHIAELEEQVAREQDQAEAHPEGPMEAMTHSA